MGVKVREKKKGSNVWWVYVNHGGQRRARRIGAKREAEDYAKEIRRGIAVGAFLKRESKSTVTFGEYAKTFMAGHVANTLKRSTEKSYGANLEKHILPVVVRVDGPIFRDSPIVDITRKDIKEFCHAKLSGGMSMSSVKILVTILSSVFTHAKEDGIIAVNPTEKPGKYLKTQDRRGKVEFLTAEECNAVLDSARVHTPRLYPLFLAALRTGMRQGELIGLMWSDVDWHGGFIVVQRTNYMGHISTPKNGRTRRVDMSDGLRDALTHHKKMLSAEALSLGRPMSEWVFPSEDGTHLWATNLRKRFDKCLTKAGLRHVPFHALRHSFASALIALGESLAYIRDQLGHHSITLTVDTYGHLVPGTNRKAVNRLDDLGKSATNSQPAVVGA